MAEEIIQELRPIIEKDGAGRHEWRSNAAKEFQKIAESATDEIIQVKLGLRPGIESEAWGSFYAAQVMVALFGNHPPIETKPNLEVFGDKMVEKHKSTAQTVYEIPQFGWVDPQFGEVLNNIFTKKRVAFGDACESILSGINIANYVHVR